MFPKRASEGVAAHMHDDMKACNNMQWSHFPNAIAIQPRRYLHLILHFRHNSSTSSKQSFLPFLTLALLTPLLLVLLLLPLPLPFTLPPQLPLQPPRHLRTNPRMLILPHPATPVPFPALRQIPIDDAAAHALPARAGADEVPSSRFEVRVRVCYAGLVDLAAYQDVSGFVAEGAGFAVGFGGFGLGHFFFFGDESFFGRFRSFFSLDTLLGLKLLKLLTDGVGWLLSK